MPDYICVTTAKGNSGSSCLKSPRSCTNHAGLDQVTRVVSESQKVFFEALRFSVSQNDPINQDMSRLLKLFMIYQGQVQFTHSYSSGKGKVTKILNYKGHVKVTKAVFKSQRKCPRHAGHDQVPPDVSKSYSSSWGHIKITQIVFQLLRSCPNYQSPWFQVQVTQIIWVTNALSQLQRSCPSQGHVQVTQVRSELQRLYFCQYGSSTFGNLRRRKC